MLIPFAYKLSGQGKTFTRTRFVNKFYDFFLSFRLFPRLILVTKGLKLRNNIPSVFIFEEKNLKKISV